MPALGVRTVLLTALLLPMLGQSLRDPSSSRSEPDPPPPGFPLRGERAPADAPVRPSALIVPLEKTAEGFTLSSAEGGVPFDIDGDGDLERVAWPAADANVAFLALDVNGDGLITSGRELFGAATYAAARNGCKALMQAFERDGNERTGSIHEGHPIYERLLLWVDGNRNGRSEPAELLPARTRFSEIGLGYGIVAWDDSHGNQVRFIGWLRARTADAPPPQTRGPDRTGMGQFFEVALQTAR